MVEHHVSVGLIKIFNVPPSCVASWYLFSREVAYQPGEFSKSLSTQPSCICGPSKIPVEFQSFYANRYCLYAVGLGFDKAACYQGDYSMCL